MRLILAAYTFFANTFSMYLIANILLMFCGEQASKRKKWFFAFITGTIFQTAFVYAFYIIGGAVSFSPIIYLVVVTPNPIFAILYCFIGIKVFSLSPIRSIKVMGHIFYLCYMIFINLNRLIGSAFFPQSSERYNYLVDAMQQVSFTLLALMIYYTIRHIMKAKKMTIRFSDHIFINFKKELILFFLKASFFYILTITLPLLIPQAIIANFLGLLIISLFFALNIYLDINASQRTEIKNKEVHISSLSKGINELNRVKHDFYNILQSYGGYLEIGDIERLKKYHASLLNLTAHSEGAINISSRMSENPALMALLLSKSEYAAKENVAITFSLQSDLADFYVDKIDICRCIACLLDNAIEAAAGSVEKKVLFTIEQKIGGQKLVIVTNSTMADVDLNEMSTNIYTSKHDLGLSHVRKIMDTYGNCTFQTVYYDHEFSVYIELAQYQ